MIYGMLSRFSMDMALESWFQDDDPATRSLTELRHQFGSDDGVYIVYEAADGDVFSEKSLATLAQLQRELDDARLVRQITEQSHLLTRIERIDSLINIRYQLAQGDTLVARQLVGNQLPESEAAREQIRQIAASQPHFKLAYFSKDYRFGGIRLKTDFGTVPLDADTADKTTAEVNLLEDDEFSLDDHAFETSTASENETAQIQYKPMQMDEYLTFMDDLKSVTQRPEFQHFKFYYTGNAPVMEFAMNSMKQASVLLGLMVLIVIGLLWFLFQSA